MLVYRAINQVDRARVAGGTLTIGNFDGVHLGHQGIVARAAAAGRPCVVLTFDPHPLAVLNPHQSPPVMTPIEYRLELLEALGAEVAVVISTDRDLLKMSPQEFVEQVVIGRFGPRAMVEGPTFGFGRDRSGDVQTLVELGGRYGFDVHVVDKVVRLLPNHHEPVAISSTLVRRLLSGGNMEAATECLGRPYRLFGRRISGRGRGRQLGFPTVNLDAGPQLLPADGVYAAVARSKAYVGAAAVSIGPAPTFGREQTVIEAHLVDFAAPFEEGALTVDLLRHLRGIEAFPSAEALSAQIARDVQQTRDIVTAYGPEGE